MALLTLRIDATGPQPAWSGRWERDGQAVGEAFDVAGADARTVAGLGENFRDIFGQQGRPMAEEDALRGMGQVLREIWLGPRWDGLAATTAGPGPHELRLVAADPVALNLPWELIELSPGLPLGCDAAWALRRVPPGLPDGVSVPPRPGPLRVLFVAAAPADQTQLDYEREEDAMLRAAGVGLHGASVYFAESGGLQEMAGLVAEIRPHVVHLSGHGSVDAEGRGTFAFEDERGRADPHGAEEIANRAFRGSGVGLVFLNGCQTSRAAVSGLCQALVAAGVPAVVGWSANVADDRATDLAGEFYRRLVRREPIPQALAHARDAIRRVGPAGRGQSRSQDATFALAQLHGRPAADVLYDPAAPAETHIVPGVDYPLLGEGIEGLRSGFVGRRRESQRLIPALREGEATFAVLTGLGGTGKSTLATRAVHRLKVAGFRHVSVKAIPAATPAEAARAMFDHIKRTLDAEFARADRGDARRLLADDTLAIDQRMRLAVDVLNDLRLILVLDNFEDTLELDTRRIADPGLASLYAALASGLTRGSRVIVTCRYLPAATPTGPSTILHLPLPEFPAHDFLKFLRRDPVVAGRIASGQLRADVLDDLYLALGGTPGFLKQLVELLHTADAEVLLEDLDGGDSGALGVARDAYCGRIVAGRLYEALSPGARDLAGRLALSNWPLPPDAAAALADCGPAETDRRLAECVSYGLIQRPVGVDTSLYQPPGVLRHWLSAPERLSAADARISHGRLATFWLSCYVAGRHGELQIGVIAGLEACIHHADQAGEKSLGWWAASRLALQLMPSGEWGMARHLLEAIPEELRDDEAWHNLARLNLEQGYYEEARVSYKRSLGIKQDLGDRAGVASALHQIATIDMLEYKYRAARETFSRLLAIRQDLGDRAGVASALHQIATIDLDCRDYPAARQGFARSLRIDRALGNLAGKASALHQIAKLNKEQGKLEKARKGYERSLRIKHETGNFAGDAVTLHNLATIDMAQGSYAEARRRLASAREIQQATGDRAGEVATLSSLAMIELNQNNTKEAYKCYVRSLDIQRTLDNPAAEASNYFQLANIAHELGRSEDCVRLLAVSWLVKKSVGHVEADFYFELLSSRCAALAYDHNRFDAMIAEVTNSYRADRGRGLIQKAFDGQFS